MGLRCPWWTWTTVKVLILMVLARSRLRRGGGGEGWSHRLRGGRHGWCHFPEGQSYVTFCVFLSLPVSVHVLPVLAPRAVASVPVPRTGPRGTGARSSLEQAEPPPECPMIQGEGKGLIQKLGSTGKATAFPSTLPCPDMLPAHWHQQGGRPGGQPGMDAKGSPNGGEASDS